MLVARLIGRNEDGTRAINRIPIHNFTSLMKLVAMGDMTAADARDTIPQVSRGGVGLDAGERADALSLLNSITNAGSATNRMVRADKIESALILGEAGATAFRLPSLIHTYLGI